MPALESVTQDSHECNRRYVQHMCLPCRPGAVRRGNIVSRDMSAPDRAGNDGLDRKAECRIFFPLFLLFSPPFLPSAPVVATPWIANYYVSIYASTASTALPSEYRARCPRGRE